MDNALEERKSFHAWLKTFCPNVYFMPPANVKMAYPCIVYSTGGVNTRFADNKLYSGHVEYSVTVIERQPNLLWTKLIGTEKYPYSKYVTDFVSDNLYHTVIDITV